ncbi:hypothetical protein RJ639_019877 [Escallonia herrerae]|uniref:Uncharacterized protein n=1 Tax=Escallonia herrerae TaxID=1293975 RepID=A0AA88VBG8_9ASTE|nr:hypothetical protein RJ639_019877 [Escallonia herrerae]
MRLIKIATITVMQAQQFFFSSHLFKSLTSSFYGRKLTFDRFARFMLEHHLFSRLPRVHLRKISPIVRELCKKNNVPYTSLSFYEANVHTIKTLTAAALQVRDLANPIPKNMLWEAVNTHG